MRSPEIRARLRSRLCRVRYVACPELMSSRFWCIYAIRALAELRSDVQ